MGIIATLGIPIWGLAYVAGGFWFFLRGSFHWGWDSAKEFAERNRYERNNRL